MAEISYPFAEDNSFGGTKTVSQFEWQKMSQLWAQDRIDFQITNSSYSQGSLPLWASISGANLLVQSGSAWVGGFYYRNTGQISKTAPTNSGSLPRTDLVVLRADMSKGSVNLEIKTGTPSANPVEPALQRALGGIWEFPLWAITLAANNGARALQDRRRYDGPGMVYAAYNGPQVSASYPQGNIVVDLDSNTNDVQSEGFSGRDGFVSTRHFGKSKTYTPSLLGTTNVNGVSALNRKGRWRWIAPNMFWFCIYFNHIGPTNVAATGSNWRLGVTLPVVSNPTMIQTISGFLNNPDKLAGLPNSMAIHATTGAGTNQLWLHYPNPNTVTEGLDGLRTIPGKSVLSISGVVEGNEFNE
ncbi:hypothetical protein ABZ353_10660 [Streptomyces niveus]|uniref:hypothetical protein n=1 Tax=Streptomyces niveus TaxID=193462 RepID=UPI0033F89E58